MKRMLMAAVLAGMAGSGAAPGLAQDAGRENDQQSLTVTGIRIGDYRQRLRDCLARNCPVNEDVDATLALAEALMLRGDYRDARHEVYNSLRRNRRQGQAFPEPVSDLYRVDARLSRHIGDSERALRSTHEILDTLQSGLPREDHRHFTARFELAELLMTMGRLTAAKRELDELARVARANGREDVAVMAGLRELMYEHIAEPNGRARGRIIELSRLTDPRRRIEAVGARMLLARIYREEGDAARADALIAEVGRGAAASGRRRLIRSPTYQLAQQEESFAGQVEIYEAIDYGNTLKRLPPNFEGSWIDVGFWVLPDGRVSSLEVVRRGSETSWAAPLLEAIRGREYTPAAEASYRLERYTLTSDMQQVAGSRIRQHSPRARVEYLDLTEEDAAPAAGARQPG